MTPATVLERQPVMAFSPHPILLGQDRQIHHVQFKRGETILEYMKRVGIYKQLRRRPYALTINGRSLPRAMWATTCPKPGTLINVYALVHGGGGGGKNPLATVAMIALMVAAPHIAVGLGGAAAGAVAASGAVALTTFGNVLAIGTMVVGGMIINSVFPPPKPQISDAQGESVSPTYSLTGGSNQIRRYQPFPKICGTHRIFPDFGAQPYAEFEGDEQYGYYIFEYGYNDVVLSDHKIGDTPLTSFTNYVIEESGADGALTLFPGNVDSVAGADLPDAVSHAVPSLEIERTSSEGATRLAVDITGSLVGVTDEGDLMSISVYVNIKYRLVGAGTWTDLAYGSTMAEGVAGVHQNDEIGSNGSVRIWHGRRTPLRRTYTWLVPSGQYEVKVSRYTPAYDEPHTAMLTWSVLRTYQPDTADYTGRKRVALKLKASELANGSLQEFSSMASALCETWDGADWVTAETSNPAWWYLDIARGLEVGGRRVWGGGLADARIDIEGLKLFAEWCDDEGLTFDAVFDQEMAVFDMLSAVALMGRATPSWGTGKLGVVWDAPNLPVTAHFGMHNIIAGSFEIDYASEELADVVEGEFINKDRNWQRDFVRVTVPGATSQARVRRIQLFGCTDVTVAAQHTNLYAAQNAFRTRRYKWRMDWEGMPAARGDVGQLTHDLTSLDYSGRFIEGGDTDTLTLPKRVPLYEDGAFIVIIKPDGTFDTYDVEGGAGDSATLTLVDPLDFNPWDDADHPCYDYRWMYGPTATPGKLVKIDKFRPISGSQVEITAVDEVPEFYEFKSAGYTYTPIRPVFGTLTLDNLELSLEGIRAGTGYLVKVTATWDVTGDYRHANVRVIIDGAESPLATGIRGRSFEFLVSDGAEVTVEVTAFSSLGSLSASVSETLSETIDFAGLLPPSDVEFLTLGGSKFSWPTVDDVDVIGYELRYYYGTNPTWEAAQPLHDGYVTDTPWEPVAMPRGNPYFLIKAVDAAKQKSVNATVASLGNSEDLQDNIVVEADQRLAGWPGVLTDGTEDAEQHLIADSTVLMWQSASASLMWSSTSSTDMWGTATYKEMTYEESVTVTEAQAGSRLYLTFDITGDPYNLEFRENSTVILWEPGTDLDVMWEVGTDADLMWDPIPDWEPLRGDITAKSSMYDFRVTTGSGLTQGVIRDLSIVLDVPDLEIQLNDQVVPVEGLRLAVGGQFDVIVIIHLTLEDDGGDAVSVKWVDKNAVLGPLIKCYTADGEPTTGVVDATIQGY